MYSASVRVRLGREASWTLVATGTLELMRRCAAHEGALVQHLNDAQVLLTIGDRVVQRYWVRDGRGIFLHPGGWFRARHVPVPI
jgi:hypothetical protein